MALTPRFIWRFFRNEQHWENLNFFRAIPIFQGLSSRQLGRVMMAMQKRTYVAGETLFVEGQPGRAVFIIKSGQVELTRRLPDGRIRSLGVLGKGQMFGEMALLEHMQRTASATVAENGEIYFLYTATLEALMRRHPSIGVQLLRNMAVMLSALLRRTNTELDKRSQAAS
jgi:CRP/FNR family transcriptional regulator